MKKIMVLGSLNMDLVTKVAVTPKVGQTVLGRGFEQSEGGKGANQAVAIAKLGGDVKMLGMVGNDQFGKRLKESLATNNVDISLLRQSNHLPTGTALIMVNQDGNNSIVVIPGANYGLTGEQINASDFAGIDYLLAQFEVPIDSVKKAFALAKKQGIKTILNPAPAMDLDDELLANTDMLIPNQTEFELITTLSSDNKDDLLKGSKALFAKGVKEVIVTLAENGVFYLNSEGETYQQNAYSVNVVDSTAAGDSFIGGLLTRLAVGDSMEAALDYASLVGALTVSKSGAQKSLPSQSEVEDFKGGKCNA